MRRCSLRQAVIGALIAVVATLGAVPAAHAHSGNQSYVYLDVTERALGGRVELPLGDLARNLDLGLDGSDPEISAELADNAAAIHDFLDDHLLIGVEGTTWPVAFETPTLFQAVLYESSDRYAIVEFDVDLGGIDMPRQFDVTFDPFLGEEGAGDNLLLIQNDWAGGVIGNGHGVLLAFTEGAPSQSIDLGDASWTNTFRESIRLGVDHIRTGPDHILFVMVLLLPSVLVFRTMWQPAKNFGSSLWRITKIVTMFTVAHTITFTLAGLDVLPLPPSKLVESIIAVSIAVTALHNLKPVAANKEWLIAFMFGLFHGMGFAGLVEGLDVPRGTQLLSLAGRNLGIEFGQTVVVLVVFPMLFLLRRTRYYRPLFVYGSIALAVVSIGWLVERVFEVDLRIAKAVDPVVEWPRSLFVMMLLTLIAAGIARHEQRRGRLLPVVDDTTSDASTRETADSVLV